MLRGLAEEHDDRAAAAFASASPGSGGAGGKVGRLSRPSSERSLDTLREELADTLELLRGLGDDGWQQRAGTGQTVREIVLCAIFRYQEVVRNLQMPLARVLAAVRGRHADAVLPGAAATRLTGELGYWGTRAAQAAERHRDRKRPVLRSGPLAGRTAGYLSAAALPREAWLDRITIAEAVGCRPDLGRRAGEIIRQGVCDVGDAWSGGRAVLVEITGPAGGRWVVGDGTPAATVRADPAGFLRLVTNRPDGHSAGTGDAGTVAAFLATRI